MDREATDVDGYADWHALTELSSAGGPPPDRAFEHPAGRVEQECLALLTSVLASLTGAGAPFVAAQPVGWSTSTAPLVEVGSPTVAGRRVAREVVEAPLHQIAARWGTHGFPGRAWAVGQQVALAAPPYADSLVLSGGPELRDALLRSDLEVFAVSRSARCPITSA